MAMTGLVKDELSRVEVVKPCCRKAEVSALLRFAGGLHLTSGHIVIDKQALTLQCMPKREDLYNESEYEDPERQLHRHVLYPTQPGDVVVVDARGDLASGIFGEMMLTFFAGRGGVGVVIDGCIRDSAQAAELDIGIWVRDVTPNYHAQTNIVPFAVNVPIACANVLVIPGDIIVADDDGVVLVPIDLAPKLLEIAGEHVEWEEFSRMRLAAGGDLRKYYPLSAEGETEYKEWLKARR